MRCRHAWVCALASTLALACGARRLDVADATASSGEDTQTAGSTSDAGTSTNTSTSDPGTGETTAGDTDSGDTDSGDTDSGDTGEEPACGDGVVDPGERCDDGNTEANDQCSADCRNPLVVCGNNIYACGDTLDNDGDGRVDLDDPECISPCDDREDVFEPGLPGQNCVCCDDCMFDSNSGAGDDHCEYEPGCDPLLPDPECVAKDDLFCAAYVLPPQCSQTCGPLTPNGCDCFGCCMIAGEARWIGIREGYADCSLDSVEECPPCTINPDCFDPCETEGCELCFLDPPEALAPGCAEPSCDAGDPCVDPYACPEGEFCQAGCCRSPHIR